MDISTALELHHYLLAAAGVLVVLEMLVPSFFFLGLAAGCVANALTLYAVGNVWNWPREAVVFSLASVAGFLAARQLSGKEKAPDPNQY